MKIKMHEIHEIYSLCANVCSKKDCYYFRLTEVHELIPNFSSIKLRMIFNKMATLRMIEKWGGRGSKWKLNTRYI